MKSFKTCTGHLSLVAIYFFPVILVNSIGSKIHPNARIINLSLTTVIPPMLNPIIYVLQTHEIKESLKKIKKKKATSDRTRLRDDGYLPRPVGVRVGMRGVGDSRKRLGETDIRNGPRGEIQQNIK
ncbi:olfactory receptor 4D10-like [Stegastes partitus]|uniref:Olfactory receptor 4D10-like n=1 Tax=Stegastes partitus TaxID=144197 RepID=A0A9Y4JJS2_9TELE|nr:PREDICTED: olfactory receptor 4D10-like [Stegastes partitus]